MDNFKKESRQDKHKVSLSVVVPAFNEENNIRGAVGSIKDALSGLIDDYEVLLFDDGSIDKTGEIIERISKENPEKIKAYHNGTNKGIGWTLQRGYREAGKMYVTGFPGDNQIVMESYKNFVKAIAEGKFDAIVPFHPNEKEARPTIRWLISRLYNFIICASFGIRVRYTNGPTAYKTEKLRTIHTFSHGFFLMAEILIKYLLSGNSYTQVEMFIRERPYGESKAISWRNLMDIIKSYLQLVNAVYIKREYRRTGNSRKTGKV